MIANRSAWAIWNGEEGVEGSFLGVYRFDTADMPAHRDGLRVALFRTRALARLHLPKVKGPNECGLYPKARIVQVTITIEGQGNPSALPKSTKRLIE